MLKTIFHNIPSDPAKLNINGINREFDPVCILDSNQHSNKNQPVLYPKLIAVGATRELRLKNEPGALDALQHFINEKKEWLFGVLGYDLKNDIETLSSGNRDNNDLPVIHFFLPKVLLKIADDKSEVIFDDSHITEAAVGQLLRLLSEKPSEPLFPPPPEVRRSLNKANYLLALEQLKKHIQRGDVYEVNFCSEFYGTSNGMDAWAIYERLNKLSQAPFSAYYKTGTHHLLSSSPERFLKKEGQRLYSQPIKGTVRRSADPTEDESLKNHLRNDHKEQTENVMIVDLVRNDLSKLARTASVKVDELFGLYTFKQVHQLISTVSCELKDGLSFSDILRATFPMGSMTGAPKLRAMQLIEEFENTKRGWYSGAVGYLDPAGNFDFSVIIRSILYNAGTGSLTFSTGSAITAKADPEKEYEECMLKARAMLEALSATVRSDT